MGHIFISYSHKDQDYVHKLQNALLNKGFNVWIDDRIDYGKTWPQEIQNNLDNCDAFILVMTEDALDSNWVQNEVTRAQRKDKPVFAILLSGETWLSLEATQYEDVIGGDLPSEKFFENLKQKQQSTPDLIPEIKYFSDNDKSIQEIRQFVEWLVITKKVCDIATLYVQDGIDKNEYNLIANSGLFEKAPMYGPLVYDDKRTELESAHPVKYEPKVVPKRDENPEGFRKREDVLARVHYILKDSESNPLAVLYLNWRQTQGFSESKKKELENYRDYIFSAIKKLNGISKIRQTSFNSELRARRWLDYNIIKKTYNTFNELVIETIYHFLEDFDPLKLKVTIGWKNDDKFIFSTKYFTEPFMSNNIVQDFDYKDDDFDWVVETTRPKFLRIEDNDNNFYKMIVPIRLHPKLPGCIGGITIECNYKPLIQEMVQPLCYLADHFGQIKVQIIDRKPKADNE